MQLSRRKFLGTALKAAALPSMPGGLLKVALAETPLGEIASIAAAPVAAVVGPLIPAGVIQAAVSSLDEAWYGLGEEVGRSTSFDEPTHQGLHRTVTDLLEEHLPILFGAAKGFRDMKATLLTGDKQRDGETMSLLKTVTGMKRQLYTEELFRMAALCPPENEYDNIYIDPDLSREEALEFGGEKHLIADLAWRASDVRMIFAGDDDDYGYDNDDDLDDLLSAKPSIGSEIDYASLPNNDFCFAGVQGKFNDFLKAAKRANFFSAEFESGVEKRQKGIYPAIQDLCRPSGICAETIHSLTNFVPEFIYDTNGRNLEEVEFYNLFDDSKLFKHTADIVGTQVNDAVRGFLEQHAAELGVAEEQYIAKGLQPAIEGLYRQHFSLVMPEIARFPTPEIGQGYLQECLGSFRPAAIEAEASEAEAQTGAAETAAIPETAAAEPGANVIEMLSPQRLAAPALRGIADIEHATEQMGTLDTRGVEMLSPQRLAAPVLQRIDSIEKAIETVRSADTDDADHGRSVAAALAQLRSENAHVGPIIQLGTSALPRE